MFRFSSTKNQGLLIELQLDCSYFPIKCPYLYQTMVICLIDRPTNFAGYEI